MQSALPARIRVLKAFSSAITTDRNGVADVVPLACIMWIPWRLLRRKSEAVFRAALLVGLCAVVLGWKSSHAEVDASSTRTDVFRLEGGRLTVRVTEIPRRTVLKRLAEVAGIEIRGVPSPGLISLAFDDLNLEDALRTVLRGQSYTLIFRTGRPSRIDLLRSDGATPPNEAIDDPEARPSSEAPVVSPLIVGDPVEALRAYPAIPVTPRLTARLGRDSASIVDLMEVALDPENIELAPEVISAITQACQDDATLVEEVLAAGEAIGGSGVRRTWERILAEGGVAGRW